MAMRVVPVLNYIEKINDNKNNIEKNQLYKVIEMNDMDRIFIYKLFRNKN